MAAGGGEQHIENFSFSYEGPFGSYDQNQLQRGLQIYTENCANCHGMRYVAIRTLSDLGYSDEQIRAYAANIEVYDAEIEDYRAATGQDYFPEGTFEGAPDLSLMAKARAGFHGPYGTGLSQLFNGMGGGEYIASIITGYTGEEKTEAGTTFYENTAFPGGWIAMPPPLWGEDFEFADGHSNSLHHEAADIAAFLMWAAEPKLEARKTAGLAGVILLSMLSVLLYVTNKRIWAPHKAAAKAAAKQG
jgi:ubiquinol-cytochrome c reductase cytochrome c1 subunit